MSYTVEIKGLRELTAKLDRLPADLEKRINGQIQRGAQVFVEAARKDAPVNKEMHGGNLRQGIYYYPSPVTGMSVTMTSNAEYSPYIEWGTITRVKVPPELAAYAIQFKGKGIRKTGGIYPHPFFFKQLPGAKKVIEDGIAAELKGMTL